MAAACSHHGRPLQPRHPQRLSRAPHVGKAAEHALQGTFPSPPGPLPLPAPPRLGGWSRARVKVLGAGVLRPAQPDADIMSRNARVVAPYGFSGGAGEKPSPPRTIPMGRLCRCRRDRARATGRKNAQSRSSGARVRVAARRSCKCDTVVSLYYGGVSVQT